MKPACSPERKRNLVGRPRIERGSGRYERPVLTIELTALKSGAGRGSRNLVSALATPCTGHCAMPACWWRLSVSIRPDPVCRTRRQSRWSPHVMLLPIQLSKNAGTSTKKPRTEVLGPETHHTLRVWLHLRRSCPQMRLRFGDIAERRIAAKGGFLIHRRQLRTASGECQPEKSSSLMGPMTSTLGAPVKARYSRSRSETI